MSFSPELVILAYTSLSMPSFMRPGRETDQNTFSPCDPLLPNFAFRVAGLSRLGPSGLSSVLVAFRFESPYTMNDLFLNSFSFFFIFWSHTVLVLDPTNLEAYLAVCILCPINYILGFSDSRRKRFQWTPACSLLYVSTIFASPILPPALLTLNVQYFPGSSSVSFFQQVRRWQT